MEIENAKLQDGGRIVIPAHMRKILNIETGDTITIRLDEDGIHLYTKAQALERARARIAPYIQGKASMVDEFIAEKRAEAAREIEEYEKGLAEMTPLYLFDSSALIAVINRETGTETAERYLHGSSLSVVNLAEIVGKYATQTVPQEDTLATVYDIIGEIIPFDTNLAVMAGAMILQTKPFGLSLGDRACLATAEHFGLEVITADKAWLKIQSPVKITLIR